MAGGYTAYYYTYTAWDVLRPDDEPKGYAYFQRLRTFFETTRHWELAPAENVTSAGWALANPGREYRLPQTGCAVYTHGRALDTLTGEWFNPLTNERIAAELSQQDRAR